VIFSLQNKNVDDTRIPPLNLLLIAAYRISPALCFLLDILKILAKVSDFSCETAKPKVAVTMLQLQFPYRMVWQRSVKESEQIVRSEQKNETVRRTAVID